MTEKLQVYKCAECGNIVEVLHEGKGNLVCCGVPMTLITEKTEDQGKEKHLPVIEKTDKGIKVKVGSVPHPMLPEHYIEWIQVITENGAMGKFLSPGQSPEAEFAVNDKIIKVMAYCNIHGLWSTKDVG